MQISVSQHKGPPPEVPEPTRHDVIKAAAVDAAESLVGGECDWLAIEGGNIREITAARTAMYDRIRELSESSPWSYTDSDGRVIVMVHGGPR